MRILVTGGAGYIGIELVKNLVTFDEVAEVVVYDNLSRDSFSLFVGRKHPGFEKITFVEGDILDSRSLLKNLADIDIVYHLAAKVTTPFANVDPHFYEQVNHWGTSELVYAVEQSKVKHLVYTSSIGIYGSSDKQVDEGQHPNPKTFYAISKYRGEEQVKRLEKKLKVHIIRCGNVFGYSPGMRFDAVINKFVFEANFKKKIKVNGDGLQTRSFIHIDKVARGLAELLRSDTGAGTYNFVEHNMSIMEIVDTLKELMPDLEFMFVNQHLSLRKILVKPNEVMNRLANGSSQKLDFKAEIEELISHLRF